MEKDALFEVIVRDTLDVNPRYIVRELGTNAIYQNTLPDWTRRYTCQYITSKCVFHEMFHREHGHYRFRWSFLRFFFPSMAPPALHFEKSVIEDKSIIDDKSIITDLDIVYELTILDNSERHYVLLERLTGKQYFNKFPEWFYVHDVDYINSHIRVKFAEDVYKPEGDYVIAKEWDTNKPYLRYKESASEIQRQWDLDHAGDC